MLHCFVFNTLEISPILQDLSPLDNIQASGDISIETFIYQAQPENHWKRRIALLYPENLTSEEKIKLYNQFEEELNKHSVELVKDISDEEAGALFNNQSFGYQEFTPPSHFWNYFF